jgi:hypothetical protein
MSQSGLCEIAPRFLIVTTGNQRAEEKQRRKINPLHHFPSEKWRFCEQQGALVKILKMFHAKIHCEFAG